MGLILLIILILLLFGGLGGGYIGTGYGYGFGHGGIGVLGVVLIIVVVLMLTGGEALEDFAEHRARRELDALLKHAPQKAHGLRKGKTTDVSFPLTVKADGGKYTFDGALPIKRLTYNIGEGEWKDTSMVADEVTIKFHVSAQ